jgi:hypothetical protein
MSDEGAGVVLHALYRHAEGDWRSYCGLAFHDMPTGFNGDSGATSWKVTDGPYKGQRLYGWPTCKHCRRSQRWQRMVIVIRKIGGLPA